MTRWNNEDYLFYFIFLAQHKTTLLPSSPTSFLFFHPLSFIYFFLLLVIIAFRICLSSFQIINQEKEKTPDRMEVYDEVKLKWEFNEFIRKPAIKNFFIKYLTLKTSTLSSSGQIFRLKRDRHRE